MDSLHALSEYLVRIVGDSNMILDFSSFTLADVLSPVRSIRISRVQDQWILECRNYCVKHLPEQRHYQLPTLAACLDKLFGSRRVHNYYHPYKSNSRKGTFRRSKDRHSCEHDCSEFYDELNPVVVTVTFEKQNTNGGEYATYYINHRPNHRDLMMTLISNASLCYRQSKEILRTSS